MPVRFEQVSFGQLENLRYLTFPAVWNVLADRFATEVRAVAARATDETVGLALALPGLSRQFELLSIYVVPMFRRIGIGAALLRAVEQDFCDQGFALGVHFLHVDQHDQSNARFFVAEGWSRPVVNKLICHSTVAQAFQTPWLVDARLPDQYCIVAWRSLDAFQRRALQSSVGHWITDDVNPFLYETDRHEATSIAIVDMRNKAVVGWVITHRLDDRTLRWTCSFVQPKLQASTLIRALWLDVAVRQRAFPELSEFIFTVPVTEPRMARFALRRMRPWLTRLAYACTTMKKVA